MSDTHKLDEILRLLRFIARRLDEKGAHLMATLDDLAAQIKKNTDVEASAVQAFQLLAAELKAAQAANDPARMSALISELDTSAQMLGAAVVANTPAAPPPPAG